MTKKEWIAAYQAALEHGVSPEEIQEKIGRWVDPETGDIYSRHWSKKDKKFTSPINLRLRDERGKRRIAKSKEQDAKFLETLKAGGIEEKEAKAILKQEKKDYKRIEEIAKRWSKDPDNPNRFNAGHETGSKVGGPDFGSNARPELSNSIKDEAGNVLKRGNQSRGVNDEFADEIKAALGIPRSDKGGQDTALKHLLERDVPGITDLSLTPADKQAIKAAGPGELADEIIASRQANIPAPGAHLSSMRKHAKLLAGAGLVTVSTLGLGVSAAEAGIRSKVAMETKDPADIMQAGASGISLAADFVPPTVPVAGWLAPIVSQAADAFNVVVDEMRDPTTKVPPPSGYSSGRGSGRAAFREPQEDQEEVLTPQ